MRNVLGLLLILGGVAFVVWLGLYVMLYGGVMAAINNWGVDNGAVVRGIIRAVFFEVAGFVFVPFYAAGMMCFSD